jgi:acetyltransferase EpsM
MEYNTMPVPITIPLLNPNEPDILLAALHVQEGQPVRQGDPICTLETTKSTFEIQADSQGYIKGLRNKAGDTVHEGDRLAYIASDPQWTPEPQTASRQSGTAKLDHPKETASSSEIPPGLRITSPALSLARRLSLDLSQLPTGQLVTEAVVREWAQARAGLQVSKAPFDPGAIVIYGGGGHGKMVIDLLRASGAYRIAGILDDGRRSGDNIMGIQILGGQGSLNELYDQGIQQAVNAVGGIGNISVRIRIFERLASAGFACPALVHPAAYLDPSASLSSGSQVFVHAYVGCEVRVGFGCIVNTGAIVSHDCRLGDYVNISPGAILAGEVEVGERSLIGMGVTVNLGVVIGPGARIGNGATVKANVAAGTVVRAGTTWPT